MSENQPKWEVVQVTANRQTVRLPVPGGWLYRVEEYDLKGQMTHTALAFVPTPRPEHAP